MKGCHTWPDLSLEEAELEHALRQLREFSLAEALRCIYRQYAGCHGKPRWGDKTPLYQLHMRAIAGHFPEARFIHIIRDGRDVALSGKNLWFGPGPDLEAQARNWKERILETRRQAKAVPYYMEVRYEDLILKPESVLREICAFIAVDYDPSMLDYHRHAEERLAELGDRRDRDGSLRVRSQQRRAIHRRTARAPDASRVFRWKREMTAEECASFERVAGDMLRTLGYELAGTSE